jgi:uncharacterized phage protein (TIGR01671 family)
MNRVIKFKVWDLYKKVFIPIDLWAVVQTDFNAFGIMLKDWENYREGEYFYSNTQVLQQFTGLTDKNGKEIYEGDILEFKNELGRHQKYTVFRVDGGLAINAHNSDFGKETQFFSACADMQTSQWLNQCSVIGNIYENPELLNEQI